MNDDLPPTEQRHPQSGHLADLDAAGVVELMNQEEYRVLRAVEQAAPAIARVAQRVASGFLNGGRTIFIGAGTSGRIALQEAAELPPTFGVSAESFTVLAAGSSAMGPSIIARTEDDVESVPRVLAAMGIGPADVLIGVTASGRTPFVMSGIQAAAGAGAWTCAISNNPDSPVFQGASERMLLDTGPEILTGSTRLKAGTAQKLVLNRITTAAMVLAGRVVSNHMVDLSGSNQKFRARSVRIVMDLAHVDADSARRILEDAEWSVRRALNRT